VAVRQNNQTAVNLLLEHGARTRVKDRHGRVLAEEAPQLSAWGALYGGMDRGGTDR